jgi:hypothetical protein
LFDVLFVVNYFEKKEKVAEYQVVLLNELVVSFKQIQQLGDHPKQKRQLTYVHLVKLVCCRE